MTLRNLCSNSFRNHARMHGTDLRLWGGISLNFAQTSKRVESVLGLTELCKGSGMPGLKTPNHQQMKTTTWHCSNLGIPHPRFNRPVWHRSQSRGSYAIKVCESPFSLQKAKGFLRRTTPHLVPCFWDFFFANVGGVGCSKLFSTMHCASICCCRPGMAGMPVDSGLEHPEIWVRTWGSSQSWKKALKECCVNFLGHLKGREETKGLFCKRVILANVPSFLFLYSQCKYLMYCIFSCSEAPRLRQTVTVPGLDL